MQLPGDATAAVGRAPTRGTWLVGAPPGAGGRARSPRASARAPIGRAATTSWRARRARALAARAARPRPARSTPQPERAPPDAARPSPDDPLSTPPNAWRAAVADPALAPPPVTPTSPLIALVDAAADATHPEFAGGRTSRTLAAAGRSTTSHGTATAAVAAAPQNGVGILGVWPGARALNVPLPARTGGITCAASASGDRARRSSAGAAVINMSYGSPARCAAPSTARSSVAVAEGIIPVAAAGNEFDEGNPLEFPASLPHVVTVAARQRRTTARVLLQRQRGRGPQRARAWRS